MCYAIYTLINQFYNQNKTQHFQQLDRKMSLMDDKAMNSRATQSSNEI